MLNQVILVGVLTKQYIENDDTYIMLRVNTISRSNKANNESCDLIPCRIGNDFNELKRYLLVGAMIGVKAKITACRDNDKLIIDAQKITLISNRREEDE